MKIRLDSLVQQLYPQYSRVQIQSWIMQARVTYQGRIVDKPGMLIAQGASIVCDFSEPRFVSRAGYKLEKALDFFFLDVTGFVVMDAGISTGGFTDCLLQRGAAKVFGVDVGYGQLHEKIRHDKRVIVMERTNLRYLRDLGEQVDLVTLDLSFISVIKVLDAVRAVLKNSGCLIVLIKPQFEATKEQVGRGGVISDEKIHQATIDRVMKAAQEKGFSLQGVTVSPLLGAEGNKEFLAYFIKHSC